MKRLLMLFAFLSIAFILLHSVVPENKSANESLWVSEVILKPVLNAFGKSVDNSIVRKAAHVLEFLFLTIIFFFLLNNPIRVFYASFTIAFLDESLQILTKRGAAITDIWIDIVGIVLGLLICLVFNKCFSKQHKDVRCKSVGNNNTDK